jgi:hypothetical protein
MIPFMRATVAIALLVAASPVLAAPSGTLAITSEAVDTNENIDVQVKKKSVKSLAAKDGSWTIYFVAFLKKPPGVKEVNIVFYDTAVKSHEETNAIQIATQASAKILVSNVQIGPEQGFKAGHTYNVLITRLVGGKEDVYARTTLTLK